MGSNSELAFATCMSRGFPHGAGPLPQLGGSPHKQAGGPPALLMSPGAKPSKKLLLNPPGVPFHGSGCEGVPRHPGVTEVKCPCNAISIRSAPCGQAQGLAVAYPQLCGRCRLGFKTHLQALASVAQWLER